MQLEALTSIIGNLFTSKTARKHSPSSAAHDYSKPNNNNINNEIEVSNDWKQNFYY